MEEIFRDLNIELLVANNCFDTDKVFTYLNGRNLLVVSLCPELPEGSEAEILINDTYNLYAIMRIKIINCKITSDHTELTCEVIPNSMSFFKRSLVRLETDFAVDYVYLKPGEDEELVPISTVKRAVLKDLTLCGAGMTIAEHDTFLERYREETVYMRLSFHVPNKNGAPEAVEIVCKVVNLKKSWKTYNVGVLFLLKSYHQYRIIENFYNENLGRMKEHSRNRLLMDKNIRSLMKDDH